MSPRSASLSGSPPGASPSQASRTTRRRFLKLLALGLPVGAGAAVGGGRAVSGAHEANSEFPGDPAAWRQRFLADARATERVARAEADAAVRLRAPGVLPAGAPPRALTAAPSPAPVENRVLRMQEDLKRALGKPIEQRSWVMAMDLRKCIGCSSCTIACKAENHLPPGVVYMPVIVEEIGEYPNVALRFMPHHCMQCDDPPCVPVCPVGATYKRPDGIVEINYDKCIGCRYCIPACPYGSRYFDFGENYTDDTPAVQPYEEEPSPEYGRSWDRGDDGSPVGNARKCQFCLHRLNVGMLPACVTTCLGGVIYFGDRNDPESLVSELIRRPNAIRLKEELGTKPKVYYLL
jgi:Fe-S-cluster-containing dehydrogenase component